MNKKNVDFLTWLKIKRGIKYPVTTGSLQTSQNEIDKYLMDHPRADISGIIVGGDLIITNCLEATFRDVVFEGKVIITNGVASLSLDVCEFMKGLKLKDLSVTRDLTITKTEVNDELLVSNLFVGGNYISDKSFIQMMLGKDKKERVTTEAITIRGQLVHL